MKKALVSLAMLALSALAWAPAMAEENPAVAAAKSANDSITTCISAMSTSIAQSNMSTDTKTLMLRDTPATCRNTVVVAAVRQGPTGGEMVWDGFKVLVGAVAQYKGNALVYGTIASLVSRSLDTTDGAINQGFNTANASIGTIGGLAGQAQGMLAAPVPEPAAPVAPAAPTVTP